MKILQELLILRDLATVFSHPRVTADCLRNLIAERHRLIRKRYTDGRGGACIFALLTEPLGSGQILDRPGLTAFFGTAGPPGEPGHVPPKLNSDHEAARALVRLWDGGFEDENVVKRYGPEAPRLTPAVVVHVAREVLHARFPDNNGETPVAERPHQESSRLVVAA